MIAVESKLRQGGAQARNGIVAYARLGWILALAMVVLASARGDLRAEKEDPQPASSVEGIELLKRVEGHYRSIEGIKADFIQIWRPGRFGGEVQERGSFWVRKPGMVRWEYFEPEHKVAYVTEERETWFYVPSEKQAVRGTLPEELPPHLALLFGTSDLEKLYTVEIAQQGEAAEGLAGITALDLAAKQESSEAPAVRLTVELSPLRVSSVVVEGVAGEETEYIFLNYREGETAPESVFRFHPPEGTEIVEEDGSFRRR